MAGCYERSEHIPISVPPETNAGKQVADRFQCPYHVWRFPTGANKRIRVMLAKSLPFLFAVALAVVWAQPAAAHDRAEGTFVQAKDGKLTLTTKNSDKKNTFDIGKDATISLDGKPAKLEDLKEGFSIAVALGEKHVITKIEAQSKPK
jgi:hypothetical protein